MDTQRNLRESSASNLFGGYKKLSTAGNKRSLTKEDAYPLETRLYYTTQFLLHCDQISIYKNIWHCQAEPWSKYQISLFLGAILTFNFLLDCIGRKSKSSIKNDFYCKE